MLLCLIWCCLTGLRNLLSGNLSKRDNKVVFFFFFLFSLSTFVFNRRKRLPERSANYGHTQTGPCCLSHTSSQELRTCLSVNPLRGGVCLSVCLISASVSTCVWALFCVCARAPLLILAFGAQVIGSDKLSPNQMADLPNLLIRPIRSLRAPAAHQPIL